MISRSLVLGYHGCEWTVAQQIVSGQKELVPSTNEYDWLGTGFYFWEDSHARALRWARDQVKQKTGKIKTPAVLGASLTSGIALTSSTPNTSIS